MEIIWTLQAQDSFFKNYEFVQNYWGLNVASDFEFQTLRSIEIIKKNPQIGVYSEDFRCNVLVIVKQISLLYEIENNKIILLNFWDNRQKPIERLNF